MTPPKKVANAVGGKTARACDSCITKRARWYCAADDAFLCQACDSSVHSANQLARRHERVRLKTTSYNASDAAELTVTPSWHHGFTKKARTPRHGKNNTHSTNSSTRQTHKSSSNNRHNHPFHLVPEEGYSDEVNSHEEINDEAQLLYMVPIFDPLVEAELCSPPSSVNSAELQGAVSTVADTDTDAAAAVAVVENKKGSSENKSGNDGVESSLHGFLATEIELAQFAADVESLLGRELENECIGMEELGLVDNKSKEVDEEEEKESNWGCCVKVEHDEDQQSTQVVLDVEEDQMGREPSFELSFDYDDESRETLLCDDEVKEEKKKNLIDLDMGKEDEEENEDNHQGKRRKILLQLDYEAVISAWACEKKSPWTNGDKPNLDHDDCWPHCMQGDCGTQIHHPYGGEMFGYNGFHPVILGDGGREARVSRYREKRRTRLFSKKIRYEVRKLNAEKRPRMKGRFVKRASFAPPTFSLSK